MNTPFKMNGFSGFGNSPAKHNDPKAKNKHDFRYDEPKNQKAHEAWHMKNNPEWLKTDDGARDFSEHNIAARETEGTIEEQEARKETPNKIYKDGKRRKDYKY